ADDGHVGDPQGLEPADMTFSGGHGAHLPPPPEGVEPTPRKPRGTKTRCARRPERGEPVDASPRPAGRPPRRWTGSVTGAARPRHQPTAPAPPGDGTLGPGAARPAPRRPDSPPTPPGSVTVHRVGRPGRR